MLVVVFIWQQQLATRGGANVERNSSVAFEQNIVSHLM